jgi:hypothetical protein
MKDEGMWFCNEWECKYRKNEIHKHDIYCDLVWDGCPDDEEFFKELYKHKNKEVRDNEY